MNFGVQNTRIKPFIQLTSEKKTEGILLVFKHDTKQKVINKVNIDNKLNFTSMISLTINTSFSLVQTYIKWKIGNLHGNGYQHISNEILQELLQKQFLHTWEPSKFSFGMMIKMWLDQCKNGWCLIGFSFQLVGGKVYNVWEEWFEVCIIMIRIPNLIVVWENCTGCPWCVSCAQLWRPLGCFLLVRSWKTIALPIFQTELSTWKKKSTIHT